MISDHEAAPFRCSSATTGPSTQNGATTPNRYSEVAATITHSQVLDRTSCQPPARSATKLVRSGDRGAWTGRRHTRKAALTTNVPESTAIATPGPAAATR